VEGVPEHEEIIADVQSRVEWFFAAVRRGESGVSAGV